MGDKQIRRIGTTHVYKLDLSNWSMAKVETTGDYPGWISKASGTFEASSRSILTEGTVFREKFESNEATFVLDLASLTWTKK